MRRRAPRLPSAERAQLSERAEFVTPSLYLGQRPRHRSDRARLELTAIGVVFVAEVVLLILCVFCFIGCAPRTDLFGEAMPGADEPGGGSAAGALVDPQAGTPDVPSNLAAVVARVPVALKVDGALFRLHPSDGAGGDGADAALGPVVAVPCATAAVGTCYRFPLIAALQPNRTYLLELASGALQEDGTAAATGVIGGFDTAADADQIAPQVIDFAVALAGPCAGIRLSTDEAVDAQIVLNTEASQVTIPAGTGQSAFDLAVPLSGLVPGARAEIVLRVTDRAGNVTESSAGEIDVPPETPPLVITEVLANPAGPEPGQEFVELRNVGTAELSLEGLRVEDAKGADVLPAAVLIPGGYALVVPSTFDPQSPRDVPPRSGTLMVPIDARIGSDGLSNGGEVVRLRMPGTGTEPIVSMYGGWVDVSAANAAGKSAHRLVDSACDHPTAWTRPPRPPTPGWGLN
jgi:hypothetical protein